MNQPLLPKLIRRNRGLSIAPYPPAGAEEKSLLRRRWLRWLRFGAGGNGQLLRRRMRAEGLRPAALRQATAEDESPPWADILAEVFAVLEAPFVAAPVDGREAIPFVDLLQPFLDLARERLRASGPAPACLAATALADLERALLQRLSETATPCLLTLFDEERTLLPWPEEDEPAPARTAYLAFIARQRREGYRQIAERFPVCLRLLSEITRQWIVASAEFCARLHADYPALCQEFLNGRSEIVVGLHSRLSDPHAGGRSVWRLDFANGQRLAYKPRPLDMEAFFARTLSWFNAWQDKPEDCLRVAPLLVRADYGWMAWIEAAPLPQRAAPAYHRRLGSLIALLRALGATDLHRENLVAAGDCPVFVDLECLFQPPAESAAGAPPIREDLPLALLQSGLFPLHAAVNAREFNNLGSLSLDLPEAGEPVSCMHAPNTDRMRRQSKPQPLSDHHRTRNAHGIVDVRDHLDDLVAGYRRGLQLLGRHRSFLLNSPASPWQGRENLRGRLLARHTWHYGLLLRAAHAPEALEDGVMFALSFEPLYRHFANLPPRLRALAAAERRDLHALDIPRFSFTAGDTAVHDARGEIVSARLEQPPLIRWEREFAALTPPAVERECALLACLLPPRPPSKQQCSAAQLIAAHAWQSASGPCWFGLGKMGDGLGIRPLPPGLYPGSAGIALALAADGASGQAASGALAVATLATLIRQLEVNGLPALGYDQGAAGILHALHACAQLCDSQSLNAAALRLSRHWLASGLLKARHARYAPDLLNGEAGLLLVLLALHRRHGDPTLLAAARRCGEIIRQQAHWQGPSACWPGAGTPALAGMSHGSSGIAVALGALFRATDEAEWAELSWAALRHESSLYVPAWCNWRDLRGHRGGPLEQVERQGISWCHGAPGIALARAALLRLLGKHLGDAQRRVLEDEFATAIATVQGLLTSAPAALPDDLCCGRAGLIDILLECGQLLARPTLVVAARTAADAAAGGDRYWFRELPVAGVDPGLFKGLAGQVYLQARLQAPDRIPCVLLPGSDFILSTLPEYLAA